ncbi:MAG: heliorhodopsin HeR [bacterium]
MAQENIVPEKTAKGLIKFNLIMGFIHLIQGFLMILLSNNFSLPITTNFLGPVANGHGVNTITETLVNIRIGPFVAAFLFISAFAHFTISAPKVKNWYVKNLGKGINYIRWYEYAFSSSLMIVIIAMLCGIYDFGALLLMFTLNGIMNLFGLIMEIHNQTTKKTDWTSFIYGCIAGIVPWIVITIYFIGAAVNTSGSIPTFVYFILGSLFLFFNIFALNMYLQYKKVGKWKDYLFGEKIYIVLSLVAKSALAWQVLSGTLRG